MMNGLTTELENLQGLLMDEQYSAEEGRLPQFSGKNEEVAS